MGTNYIIIACILFFIVAFIFKLIRLKSNPDGCIRINTDDPEKDTYTLELMIPFGELDTRKSVYFKVVKD